jgi:AP-1-like factor
MERGQLEDKVAALQAQNDVAQSENENLRDLLSRLQNENVVLKNSPFTFAVPKNASNTPSDQVAPVSPPTRESPASLFGTASRSSISAQSPSEPAPRPSPRPSIPSGDIDWNSLTAFDPSVLKLLDESPQQTATDGAMSMDFGFGENSTSKMQYTTLASNPLFMSFADTFDTTPDNSSGFNFDMQGMSPWPSNQSDVNVTMEDGSSLDSLFGGQYMEPQPPVDFNVLLKSPQSALSPVAHASVRSTPTTGSSPASNYSLFNTPRDSASSFSEEGHDENTCPKTKEEAAKKIAREGLSSFAPPETSPVLRKGHDGPFGSMVMCKGSNFPKTAKSDQNIEVLSAWRSITSNPKFKVNFFSHDMRY